MIDKIGSVVTNARHQLKICYLCFIVKYSFAYSFTFARVKLLRLRLKTLQSNRHTEHGEFLVEWRSLKYDILYIRLKFLKYGVC